METTDGWGLNEDRKLFPKIFQQSDNLMQMGYVGGAEALPIYSRTVFHVYSTKFLTCVATNCTKKMRLLFTTVVDFVARNNMQ